MSKIGRKITAYHPEILVKRGDSVMAIKADLEDWCEDSEVLTRLAAVHPGCQTVGDLVEAIQRGDSPGQEGSEVIPCCISSSVNNPVDEQPQPLDWDEPI